MFNIFFSIPLEVICGSAFLSMLLALALYNSNKSKFSETASLDSPT